MSAVDITAAFNCARNCQHQHLFVLDDLSAQIHSETQQHRCISVCRITADPGARYTDIHTDGIDGSMVIPL